MSLPSPYDDPVPHGWRAVCASLRVAVCLMCWGLAAQRLYIGTESPAAALLESQGWLAADWAARASEWSAYGLIGCGLLTLFRPCWALLLPVTAWVAAGAAAPAVLDEDPLRTLDLAVLVFAPLVLMLIEFWPPSLKFSLGRTRFALGLLRLGIVVSLLAQSSLMIREIGDTGAWSASLRAVLERVTPFDFSEPLLSRALATLAAVNVALGLVILTARQRSVLFCAAVWSCALGTIPVIVEGVPGSPSLLVDAARGGASLSLYWFWMLAIKEQSPTIVPAM